MKFPQQEKSIMKFKKIVYLTLIFPVVFFLLSLDSLKFDKASYKHNIKFNLLFASWKGDIGMSMIHDKQLT